jgi:hypothetical protein
MAKQFIYCQLRGMIVTATNKSDVGGEYEITVLGNLDPKWSDWFDGFVITPGPGGECRLVGTIPDQAALYGILNKISGLGLPLLSVQRLAAEG